MFLLQILVGPLSQASTVPARSRASRQVFLPPAALSSGPSARNRRGPIGGCAPGASRWRRWRSLSWNRYEAWRHFMQCMRIGKNSRAAQFFANTQNCYRLAARSLWQAAIGYSRCLAVIGKFMDPIAEERRVSRLGWWCQINSCVKSGSADTHRVGH